LIEQHALSLTGQGQMYTVHGWLNILPDILVRERPQLCLLHAVTLMFVNRLEEAKSRLRDAERCLQGDTSTGQARLMLGHILSLRATTQTTQPLTPEAGSTSYRPLLHLPCCSTSLGSLP
jgi:ATP/maltotriose-dependent transcriptional regulator MalT